MTDERTQDTRDTQYTHTEQESGLSRRSLLKQGTMAGLAAAGGAGLGLFGGKAPAFAQQRELHVLAWSHFIPPADEWTRNTAVPEFQRATGIQVRYETINQNDILTRASAAVEGGQGPDVIQFSWNAPHLYASNIANHDRINSEIPEAGQDYQYLRDAVVVDGTYRAVPYYGVGNAIVYRKDIFQQIGEGPSETWEDYLRAGTKAKREFGMPIGVSIGHTQADSPYFAYSLLWGWGGMEVDENQKVIINRRQTRFALEFFRQFWFDACDEGGVGWDDSSNNRAYFAHTICASLNAASIYQVAKANPDTHGDLADRSGHFLNPWGPGGRYHTVQPQVNCVMGYSNRQEEGFEWIKFLMQPENYEAYIEIMFPFGLGRTPRWEEHPIWDSDPALKVLATNPRYGRNFGHAGPFDRKASRTWATYVIPDLFSRVLGGTSPEASMSRAENELKAIYEA